MNNLLVVLHNGEIITNMISYKAEGFDPYIKLFRWEQ